MQLVVFVAMLVLAPDGWVETSPDPLISNALESQAFHAPGDPSAVYLVSRAEDIDREKVLEDLKRRYDPTLATHAARNDDGAFIDDINVVYADASRTHIRVLAGSRPGVLIGMCHGRGALFDACEAKLGLLRIQVDKYDYGAVKRILLLIVGILMALGAIGSLLWKLYERRQLARSPKLVDGDVVTITGVVRIAGTPIEAPLSGRACVLHRSRGRLLVDDRLVAEPSETEVAAFVVETRQGVVRIDGRDLDLSVTPMTVPTRSTPGQRAFRSRHHIDPELSVAFDEIVVEPGSKITIRGIVSVEPDHANTFERGYRDNAPTAARLVASRAQPLTILRIW